VQKSHDSLGIHLQSQKGGASLFHSFSQLTEGLSMPLLLELSISGPIYILLTTPFMSLVMSEAIDDWLTDLMEGPLVS
jgi:hypothetical protein